MKKRAYISVYDKDGIIEFARELVNKYDYEIVSTGGTYNILKDAGLEIVDVQTVTGFKELLSGKVKSLHPNIFGGILANTNNICELEEISQTKICPIDMVVVNLYPFESYADTDADINVLVSNIDIGGVALIRAGAKNFECVTTIWDKNDYPNILKELQIGGVSIETKKRLAIKAFNRTSRYDGIICRELSKRFDNDVILPYENLSLLKEQDLRYGENPHQAAALYKSSQTLDYEILNGKELSYNNIIDADVAIAIVSEFFDVNAAAIIKHTTPCGVALGKTIEEAYLKAFDADPISAFGGIIAFSQKVDLNIAKHASNVFLEVLIAPEYDEDALELLKRKKNLRIIKLNTPLRAYKSFVRKEYKVTPFGVLVQESDKKELDVTTFKTVTKKKPTQEQVEDMVFAWKIVKHVKSNAIVIAKDLKAIGISGGQTSRIGAIEIALLNCADCAKDAVLASDGFMPAVDNIQFAAQERIAAIIQPGGSIKDNDVVALADKLGLAMITTGIRHFKH